MFVIGYISQFFKEKYCNVHRFKCNGKKFHSSFILFYMYVLHAYTLRNALHRKQTSEDVVLVVMICLSTHFNETSQTLGDHKFWNQVLIVLCNRKKMRIRVRYIYI